MPPDRAARSPATRRGLRAAFGKICRSSPADNLLGGAASIQPEEQSTSSGLAADASVAADDDDDAGLEGAASKIQALRRGKQARDRASAERASALRQTHARVALREHEAAVKIQATAKGKAVRVEMAATLKRGVSRPIGSRSAGPSCCSALAGALRGCLLSGAPLSERETPRDSLAVGPPGAIASRYRVTTSRQPALVACSTAAEKAAAGALGTATKKDDDDDDGDDILRM
eukprot:2809150-Prymnesium_polylepis.1